MVYEHVHRTRAKSVTFAPMVSIRKIPAGEGTWENGQPVATTPSDWESDNGERLAAQALKAAEEQERAESALFISASKAKDVAFENRNSRNGPSKVMPKRKPVPKAIRIPEPAFRPRAATFDVTFDSFLPAEKLQGRGPLKTPNSLKSFADAASMKSFSEKFKAKLRTK